jgi:ribonuclease HI
MGSAEINPIWKDLWKLKIPSKIKIFSWKALHGTLPCRAILADRHMKVAAQCPVCLNGAENIRHALFTCDRAIQVWKALGLEQHIEEALVYDRAGSVALKYLIGSDRRSSPVMGQPDLQTLVAVGAWYIWWERRQAVKGEKVPPPLRSAMPIIVLSANYLAAARSKGDGRIRKNGWEKPPKGLVKLNVDASYDENSKTGATGAILRDSKGFFIAASNQFIAYTEDVLSAEAIALKHGLELALNLGCNRIMVNSDSLMIIEAMNSAELFLGPAAIILLECARLASECVIVTFHHCPREANGAADELARRTNASASGHWIDEPPNYLRPQLVKDLTLLDDVITV